MTQQSPLRHHTTQSPLGNRALQTPHISSGDATTPHEVSSETIAYMSYVESSHSKDPQVSTQTNEGDFSISETGEIGFHKNMFGLWIIW